MIADQCGVRQTAPQLRFGRPLHWQWSTARIPVAHRHVPPAAPVELRHPRLIEIQKKGPLARRHFGPEVRRPLPASSGLGERVRGRGEASRPSGPRRKTAPNAAQI